MKPLGLGIGAGTVASIAFDVEHDRTLCAISAGANRGEQQEVGWRRGVWLRAYAYAFIEAFAPTPA